MGRDADKRWKRVGDPPLCGKPLVNGGTCQKNHCHHCLREQSNYLAVRGLLEAANTAALRELEDSCPEASEDDSCLEEDSSDSIWNIFDFDTSEDLETRALVLLR